MIIGIDPGTRRCGVAVADLETRFARPLEVIDVQRTDPVARIADIVEEIGAIAIVVGNPISLDGTEGPSAGSARVLAGDLARSIDIPVVSHDERLSTVVAERGLIAAGGKRTARKALVDAVAAQVMLQSWLDSDGEIPDD
jgi:putative holliday junction resolvase